MSVRLEQDIELQRKIAKAIGLRKDPDFMRFSKTLDSGYTYIGQFISHELTPITDPLRASRDVSGNMDLQSLYGQRQNYQFQHIGADDLLFDRDGCFKFSAGSTLDLQRNRQGVAVIPESRNDDHVIIAQLHIFWQRLHNLFIQRGFAPDALAAKRLLVLTFQLMVVEDHLSQILNDEIYDLVIGKNHDFLPGDERLWLDVFRFATFKFGHSTIRNSYSLRRVEDDPMPSRDLSQLFMGKRQPRCLHADDTIDWRAFFCMHGQDQFEGSMPIDTSISGFMNEVPTVGGIAIHIATRNLQSELAAKLPSGIEIARQIEAKLPDGIKSQCQLLTNDSIEDASFNHLGLHIEDLTIWLYTLLEAQLAPSSHKLGMVASSVNAHVIKQAIKNADISIYQQGEYSFDQVVNKLGDWGEVLKSFAEHHKSDGKGKLRMKDLVNYLIDNEEGK